jgi:hypothetical protein
MNVTAGHGTPEADDQALAALQSAGLNAIFAPLDYSNCTDTAPGRVQGVVIQIGREWSPESQFQCTRLWLPVTNQQTVNCTPMVDAGAESCTITFSRSPG